VEATRRFHLAPQSPHNIVSWRATPTRRSGSTTRGRHPQAIETLPPYHNSHSLKSSLPMRHEESICEMDPRETWTQEVMERAGSSLHDDLTDLMSLRQLPSDGSTLVRHGSRRRTLARPQPLKTASRRTPTKQSDTKGPLAKKGFSQLGGRGQVARACPPGVALRDFHHAELTDLSQVRLSPLSERHRSLRLATKSNHFKIAGTRATQLRGNSEEFITRLRYPGRTGRARFQCGRT